jgi:DNA-directed RNA polymerase beta' subunit
MAFRNATNGRPPVFPREYREPKYVRFSILTQEEIVESAVIEAKVAKEFGESSVCSKEMGITEGRDRCNTCGNDYKTCTGHFGYIRLATPIIHPFFFKEIQKFLNIFCPFCFHSYYTIRMMETDPKLSSFDRLNKYCLKVVLCSNCHSQKPTIYIDDFKFFAYYIGDKDSYRRNKKENECFISPEKILELFKNIKEKNQKELDFIIRRYKVHDPLKFILLFLPVLPPHAIPEWKNQEGKRYSDNVSRNYMAIIKTCEKIGSLFKRCSNEVEINKHVAKLEFLVRSTFDNSHGSAVSKSSRQSQPIKAIGDRLKGKSGLIRGNMMGKRVDHSARTVIGPEPNIGIDEVGISYDMAKTLTVSEVVCEPNIGYLRELLRKGKINMIEDKNEEGSKIINVETTMGYNLNPELLLRYGDMVIRTEENKSRVIDPEYIRLVKGKFLLKNGDVILHKDGTRLTVIRRETDEEFFQKFSEKRLRIGNIVHRQLRNGDYVIFNRQPTIHKHSMMSHRVVILPYRSLRMNVAICAPYNSEIGINRGDEKSATL